ncbi:hypothetical protein M407DRAFT_23561 [Tulasnella calospora MUT 4182]|uniref:F-box domain-containing protein n=1 Tax=Tulasnella calospora MUT 4182 TaxID=1051891 RepID=A0A0C3QAA1_9AGAM|nr:hypothetical protein M407DRAFT_23561 [Tulasnella calospora MUT 4182]
MKPPQSEAVVKALSILMESVNEENDAQFVFTGIPATFAPLSSLPDNVEALKLAKSYINTELDTVISGMQHRRNLAASIHKLPTEVLVMIFAAYYEFSSLLDDHCLLDLMTVNKLWYDAIVQSPQLWTVLESDFSTKITKLVLRRSKNLPLTLIWNNTDCDESEDEEFEEILDLVAQNSRRLKSIEMLVPEFGGPNVRRLLESNMPRLERLEVRTAWETERSGERLEKFKLSDGPSLQEIALDTTFLSSWSSPRLIGLFGLELTRLRLPPSIQELLNILSNSPQLERLRLCELDRSDSWKPPLNESITLPRLKEIWLYNLARPYLSAMLTSIYTPSSSNVHIINDLSDDNSSSVLEEVCSPGNIQLAALLGLGDSGSPPPGVPIPINIVVAPNQVRIVKVGGAEDREIVLNFEEDLCSRVVDQLGHFFLALPQIPTIDLVINTDPSNWENTVFNLLPWGRSLCTLSVHGLEICRPVLKQLAERTEDPTTGVLAWVGPNLTSIRLCYNHPGNEVPELDGAAVEALVRKPMDEMKAVRKDAASRALSVLIGGIYKENGCDILYSGIESAKAIPVDRLPTIRVELKAAKALINQQVDQLIARIAFRWNKASLVHQLPVEVLAMILAKFQPSPPISDGSPSLLKLLLVCRTWYDTIMGSPQLWGYLDAQMPHKIAQLVINRSQPLPFSVNWHTYEMPIGPKRWGLPKMLDLAIENSTRVKKVDIRAPRWSRPNLRKFLQAPTPVLEPLRAQVEPYDSDSDADEPLDDFVLSGGSPLKHLSLRNVETRMDSPRLSNLVTLNLQDSPRSTPLKDLLPALSSSRRLKQLRIRGYSIGTGQVTIEARTPVTLPHLKELVLSDVQSGYSASMLASIYTPRCSYIEVRDSRLDKADSEVVKALDAIVWRPGNDQADVILGHLGSTMTPRSLKIEVITDRVTIQSPQAEEPCCNLDFARADVPQMMKRLATILSQWPSCPPLEIQINHGSTWHANNLDLPFWGEHLHSLVAWGNDACRAVTQQISRHKLVPGSNEIDWSFQKLSKIVIRYGEGEVEDPALDAEAMLSLVRRRWAGEDGLAAATQPSHFEVYCRLADFPRLCNLEGALKRIVPSFELRDLQYP